MRAVLRRYFNAEADASVSPPEGRRFAFDGWVLDVTRREVAPEMVPEDALTDPEEAVGQMVVVDIARDGPVKIMRVGGLLEHLLVCDAVFTENLGEPRRYVFGGGPGRKPVYGIELLYTARGDKNPICGDIGSQQDPV